MIAGASEWKLRHFFYKYLQRFQSKPSQMRSQILPRTVSHAELTKSEICRANEKDLFGSAGLTLRSERLQKHGVSELTKSDLGTIRIYLVSQD